MSNYRIRVFDVESTFLAVFISHSSCLLNTNVLFLLFFFIQDQSLTCYLLQALRERLRKKSRTPANSLDSAQNCICLEISLLKNKRENKHKCFTFAQSILIFFSDLERLARFIRGSEFFWEKSNKILKPVFFFLLARFHKTGSAPHINTHA